jgi:hypothetical protein
MWPQSSPSPSTAQYRSLGRPSLLLTRRRSDSRWGAGDPLAAMTEPRWAACATTGTVCRTGQLRGRAGHGQPRRGLSQPRRGSRHAGHRAPHQPRQPAASRERGEGGAREGREERGGSSPQQTVGTATMLVGASGRGREQRG